METRDGLEIVIAAITGLEKHQVGFALMVIAAVLFASLPGNWFDWLRRK